MMQRVYHPVAALADFDFDGLYAASLTYLNGVNNRWPKGFDADQRKAHYRKRLEQHIASPIWLGMVCREEGRDLALTGGLLDNGVYHITEGLAAPDENGSRAYLYTAEQSTRWAAYLWANGVRRLVLTMPLGSSLAATFTARHGAPAPKIVDGYWRQEFSIKETRPCN